MPKKKAKNQTTIFEAIEQVEKEKAEEERLEREWLGVCERVEKYLDKVDAEAQKLLAEVPF